jgi:hypothetical protein
MTNETLGAVLREVSAAVGTQGVALSKVKASSQLTAIPSRVRAHKETEAKNWQAPCPGRIGQAKEGNSGVLWGLRHSGCRGCF